MCLDVICWPRPTARMSEKRHCMKARRPYWTLSRIGSTQWVVRLDEDNPSPESWGTRLGRRLRRARAFDSGEWPIPPPQFVTVKSRRFLDVPDCLDGDFYLVSERLRLLLEAAAPNAAQFLPARLRGPPSSYWVMNVLRVFDCLDKEASTIVDEETGTPVGGYERPFMPIPVIDPCRIPPDGVLGRLKGDMGTILVRRDLKRTIEKAKIKGIYFHELVAFVTEPSSITWRRSMPDPDRHI